MPAKLLSGKQLATVIRAKVADDVKILEAKGVEPTLAIVVATEDGGTDFYVRHIVKAAEETGINCKLVRLKPTAGEAEIKTELENLAADSKVHGIILQTPLPKGVSADNLRSLIPPQKDVDGANPLSAGRVISGLKAFAPSTAMAVMEILKRYDIPVSCTHCVIIGRSLVVGKPLAHLLLAADATVTICHSKTRDLKEVAKNADILVVAAGKPRMVTADFIKPGTVVIDVGTTASADGLVGDVDHQSIQEKAAAYSPVPGGVGPVTTAILLSQTVQATTWRYV